jgi:hypothetical protein
MIDGTNQVALPSSDSRPQAVLETEAFTVPDLL